MRKIHTGEAFFPFYFQKDDGLGNDKIHSPALIYVAKKTTEFHKDTWETGKVICVNLGDVVDDFIEMTVSQNGKISPEQTDNAKELVSLLRSLAIYVEEHIGE
jgi:hypothetical protein